MEGHRLRFEGQVAAITGAGRGLGRAHALFLAARGARIVVNDLGSSVDGSGEDSAPGQSVVAEIREQGGEAILSTADVSDVAGAGSIIDQAVSEFGRIDILVNNAGSIIFDNVTDLSFDALMRQLSIHAGGTFNVAKAAWPHMTEQGYGRIVNTTSGSLFGAAFTIAYATCKGAIVSMTRSLADAGHEHGIMVNAVAPAAETRMVHATASRGVGVAGWLKDTPDSIRSPAMVSPLVALLSHRDCPVTGEVLFSGYGYHAKLLLGRTNGMWTAEPTPEQLLEQWDSISAHDRYSTPSSSRENTTSVEDFLRAHRPREAPAE